MCLYIYISIYIYTYILCRDLHVEKRQIHGDTCIVSVILKKKYIYMYMYTYVKRARYFYNLYIKVDLYTFVRGRRLVLKSDTSEAPRRAAC